MVGIIWFAKKDEKSGFIYDIDIDEKHQGRGYGTNAMKEIEV